MQSMNQQQDSMDMNDSSGSYHQHNYLSGSDHDIVNPLYHDPQPVANYAISPRQQQEMKMGDEQPLPVITEQYNVSPTQGWGSSYPVAPGQEATTGKGNDDSRPDSAKTPHTLSFGEEFDIPAIQFEQQPNMQPINQQQDNMDMYLLGPDHSITNSLYPDPQPVANYTMSPGQQQEMKMGDEQSLFEMLEDMSHTEGWGNSYPAATGQEPQSFYTPSLGEELDISAITFNEQPNMQPMNQQQDNLDMNLLGLDQDFFNSLCDGFQLLPNYALSSVQQQEMMLGHEQPPPESMEQYNLSPTQGWGNSYPAATGEEPTTSKNSYKSTPYSAKLTAKKQPSSKHADQRLTDSQAKLTAPRKRQKQPSSKHADQRLTDSQAKLTAPRKRQKQPSSKHADQRLTDSQAKLTAPRKRQKKNPQKSNTGFQMFFGDTHTAIRGQNPNTSFGELSKIVSSMWNDLDSEHKNVYKNLARNSKGAGENKGMGDVNEQQQQLGVLQSPMGAVPNNMNMTQHNNSSMQQVPSQQQVPQYIQHMQHTSPHSTVSSSPPGPSSAPATSAVRPSSVQQNAGQGAVQLSKVCIRDGCSNLAIWNDQWEDEYCSVDCAIIHVRKVYFGWLPSNEKQS